VLQEQVEIALRVWLADMLADHADVDDELAVVLAVAEQLLIKRSPANSGGRSGIRPRIGVFLASEARDDARLSVRGCINPKAEKPVHIADVDRKNLSS
jgi:hypothetical protein